MEAIEQAMAAAYKKDYGKKGQIIRAEFDMETGKTDFFQVKIVVDESIAILEGEKARRRVFTERMQTMNRHFNAEHHILFEDAKKNKKRRGAQR